MTPLFQTRWGMRLARCAAFAACLVAAAAQAAPMPNAARRVSITAREQPIGAFLQDLFAAVDVPASVSANLHGAVNGTFSGPADRVLRDLSRVYNMVSYYDGAVMHIVPAAELSTRTFAVSRPVADRMLRQAAELNLTDTRNTLRTTEGNVAATGTKRFIEQIDEMLRGAQAQAVPALPGGAVAGTMDFRVFYLRYGWAQDTTMNVGGRQVVGPGVASILRSLVGSRSSSPIAQDILTPPTLPHLGGQGLKSQRTAGGSDEAARNSGAVDTLVAALGV